MLPAKRTPLKFCHNIWYEKTRIRVWLLHVLKKYDKSCHTVSVMKFPAFPYVGKYFLITSHAITVVCDF